MHSHDSYMLRAIDLAYLGAGKVSPNPMVGAVIVYKDRIIGEGYHQAFGHAHAEVNAVANVAPEDRPLLSQSTLYVSLEPCCIYGKTPPCTELIIKHKIPKVVIAAIDQTPQVNGKSLQILKEAGVEVHTAVLEKKGKRLSAYRNVFVSKRRPYILLKYAQSQNGFIGVAGKQVWISNHYSKRLVHKWRSEMDAILIGTNTAICDNPSLTNRLYFGGNPLRIVLDKNGRIPSHAKLFDGKAPTLVITETESKALTESNIQHHKLLFDDKLLPRLLEHLYSLNISSLLVEGGAKLLKSFIEADLWDEARVLVGNQLITDGIPAPDLASNPTNSWQIGGDRLELYFNEKSHFKKS